MSTRKREKKPKRKLAPSAQIRLRAYSIIDDKVAEGVKYGHARAHKHTDSPTDEEVIDAVSEAVMNALSEVIDWEASG